MLATSLVEVVDGLVGGPEQWVSLPAGGAYAAATARAAGACDDWEAWEPVLERLCGLIRLCASLRIPVHHPDADLAAGRAETIVALAAERSDPAEVGALLDGAEVLLGDAVRALDVRACEQVSGLASALEGLDPDRAEGMEALARAIAQLDPQAPSVASLREALPQARELARWASSLVDAPVTAGGLLERSERSVRLWKAAALLGNQAGFAGARETVPLDAEWGSLSTPGQCIDRLNSLYYRTKGTGIYQDFWTLVSSSSYLAQVDAQAFRSRILARAAEGHTVPDELRVIEVGIGDGRFGADFLEALQSLDRVSNDGVQLYPRVHYFMVDLSEAMLRGAAQNPRVVKHHQRLKLLCCDAAAIKELDKFHYLRFHELFDDLDRTAILYLDGEGRAHEVQGRLVRHADAELKGAAGEPRSHADLAQALADPGASGDAAFALDTFEHVEVEMKLEPVDVEGYPSGDLLAGLTAERRGVAFAFPHGCLGFLDVLLDALDPVFGAVRVFDYGFAEVPRSQNYAAIAQLVRTYGGSRTHNVNFPALAARAEQRGFSASVRSVGAFCRDNTGLRAFVGRFAVPLTGTAGHARFTRAEGAPFPLERLTGFPRIEALAGEHTGEGQDYASFVTALRAEGLISAAWTCHDHPGASGLLDNLALDLEFALNALFRRVVLDNEKAGRAWLSGAQLERLETGLARLGLSSGEEDMLDRLWRSPAYKKFLVLEVLPS